MLSRRCYQNVLSRETHTVQTTIKIHSHYIQHMQPLKPAGILPQCFGPGPVCSSAERRPPCSVELKLHCKCCQVYCWEQQCLFKLYTPNTNRFLFPLTYRKETSMMFAYVLLSRCDTIYTKCTVRSSSGLSYFSGLLLIVSSENASSLKMIICIYSTKSEIVLLASIPATSSW